MKKLTLIAVLFLFAVSMVAASGCDNRSQLEKDADKAASKINKALN